MVRLSEQERPANETVKRPGAAPLLWGVRTVLVALGLLAWFKTQALIGSRPFTGSIGDGLLDVLTPVHDYLMTHVGARNALLISSSAVIDALGIFLLASSIVGKTMRPFVGLLMLFALRQICQAVCVLPTPPEMIWPKEGPGFPSLLVTYGVGNDLFFSGHTAMAVFGAFELGRRGRWWVVVGVWIVLFEVLTVLALRAHWTMDVYAGAVTALLVGMVAGWVAPRVDGALARLAGRRVVNEA
ncbi:MAG: phosphatase PAP2-related protein [Phycisphaerae bacterium]